MLIGIGTLGDLRAVCRSFTVFEVIFEMLHPVRISAGACIYEFNELYHIIHRLLADVVLDLAGIPFGHFIAHIQDFPEEFIYLFMFGMYLPNIYAASP